MSVTRPQLLTFEAKESETNISQEYTCSIYFYQVKILKASILKFQHLLYFQLLGYSLGFDITPDGSTVVSGSSDGKIYCYNYQTGKQFRTINTDMDVIMDTSFNPLLSTTLVCCAWDGSVQVWK